MHDENCIFCKIAAGEIPTNKLYEDDVCIVFRDLEPLMPTHVLIIPKDHYRDITDDVPPETLGHCFSVVKKIAQMEGLDNGFRILVNTGDDASQSVKHFHIHILGGGLMPRPNDQDWGASATNASKFYKA
ncbi:MAG: histidine triad nucleotide-binding protein [Atopobiaceae bacterium]|nr:histidine triad nucleotide-binding protein [Atopobiaceae bacterium]